MTKDGTVSAEQVKEELAEDVEKCDFRIPEKNNGISLVVPTENGYQVKMKKAQEFEVAVPEQEEKDGVLFVQFRIENKKPKKVSKYLWKESEINFRQSSMYIITEIPYLPMR